MFVLSNSSRSDSRKNKQGTNQNAWGAVEWENIDASLINNKKIIDAANKILPLKIVISKYNMHFEKRYSPNGWTHIALCPFKDHHDSSPSFSYNPVKGCFNCFGCNRGGRAVQFLSYIKGIAQIDAAQRILNNFKFNFDDIEEEKDQIDQSKVENLLFNYANCVREFREKYKTEDAFKYADDVTWNLDVYLRKHVPLGTINIDNLEIRIMILKEQLELFEEK